MKPSDFLNLAQGLAANGSEAALRTAVSRAYYCAFHSAILLIKEMGVSLPAGPESHRKVLFCLLESQVNFGLEAGDVLQTLRQDRNKADYEIEDSRVFNSKRVQVRVEQSQIVCDLLQKCREEPIRGRFRLKVREYAAKVLRLSVTER